MKLFAPYVRIGFVVITLGVLTSTISHAGVNQWTATGFTGRSIFALAVDPKNPATIYAGTDQGVFKSVDHGTSWAALNSAIIAQVLTIDPRTPTTVYAGAGSTVSKSSDGGTTWATVNLPQGDVTVLVIDPLTPTTLYAGYGKIVQTIGGLSGCCTDVIAGGALKSTDGGATWTDLGLIKTPIHGLAFDPTNPGILYAYYVIPGVTVSDKVRRGVLKSSDGGVTWSETSTTEAPPTLVPGRAIDPTNPAILYANGSTSVLWSTDSGKSWVSISTGLDSACPIHSLAIDPVSGSTLYVGLDAFERDGIRSCGGVFALQIVGAPPPDLMTVLESPEDHQPVSGIGLIRGWIFPTRSDVQIGQIRIALDDDDLPGDASCCSVRWDVQAAFPGFPAEVTSNSGWGIIVNWGTFSSGEHTIRVDAYNRASGQWLSSATRTVIIVNPGDFEFLDQFDLSQAKAGIVGDELTLAGVVVRDKASQQQKTISAHFRWFTNSQSLAMVQTETSSPLSSSRSLLSTLVASISGLFHRRPTLVANAQAASGIVSYFESPEEGQAAASIGIVRGWAFPEDGRDPISRVSLAVDGVSVSIIPCCSLRNDVYEYFNREGNFKPAALFSGWGMVLNYGNLSAGFHTLAVQLEAPNGATQTLTHTVRTSRIGGFSFVDQFDLSTAVARLEGEEIVLNGVRVRDKASQQTKVIEVRLRWFAHSQALGIVESSE